MKFLVGDSVRTTVRWNSQYGVGPDRVGLKGQVQKVVEYGFTRPERNVQVTLAVASRFRPGIERMWFDPEDLELDE